MLVSKPEGNYRYLPSSTGGLQLPFCNGVIADAGYEIVRATLEHPVPYRAGFDLIESHLNGLGRPRQALCALELRCAEPYSVDGFRAFNVEYAQLLGTWGLHGGAPGTGTTARTNIAPVLHAPSEQVLFAFSYTVPFSTNRPTFILSGAAASRDLSGTREKVAALVQTLDDRLKELGVSWDLTTETVAYAPQDIEASLRSELLPRIGPAVLNGVRWFPSLAPVAGTEIELGAHGVRQEIRLPVS
jgi:hypothetical protein